MRIEGNNVFDVDVKTGEEHHVAQFNEEGDLGIVALRDNQVWWWDAGDLQTLVYLFQQRLREKTKS